MFGFYDIDDILEYLKDTQFKLNYEYISYIPYIKCISCVKCILCNLCLYCEPKCPCP